MLIVFADTNYCQRLVLNNLKIGLAERKGIPIVSGEYERITKEVIEDE
ncbi:hypothetical protein HMPREF0322_04961 [Desulfitobacterium hafniense DP7]|uniref:Uncharacterized protein n=1 Tax=Desulfitobacterium hafniense DP7 TaxID=537010 RepID=G9XVE8_DESHA|nr:hypothetical protein HMPREF0322_04961 [Desulfitobacterium hafniense DP7]